MIEEEGEVNMDRYRSGLFGGEWGGRPAQTDGRGRRRAVNNPVRVIYLLFSRKFELRSNLKVPSCTHFQIFFIPVLNGAALHSHPSIHFLVSLSPHSGCEGAGADPSLS